MKKEGWWYEAFLGVIALGAFYLLIQWITTSFAITGNGTIRWADGWEETKCIYLDCSQLP